MTSTSALDDLACYVPALMLRRMAADVGATMTPSVDRFPAAVLMADLSGFTALTEYLTRHNPDGAEELTRILDLYFGHLVRVVSSHGGDVVKFAGDGLMALWYGDEPLPDLTQRAVQCGMAVQMMMAPDVWGTAETASALQGLKVRVGVSAGEVTTMHLGGVFGRWELLVTGDAVRHASQAESQARPGEVAIAAEAWPLVAETCAASPLDTGAMRLDTLLDYLEMRPLSLPPLIPAMAETLRAYLPKAILARLDAGQTAWLAEMRRVTVLFINLPDLRAETPLRDAQSLMRAIQSMLYRYEGSVSRLGTDNKGPTLVAALGLPPLAHEDDPERGVRAALAIHAALAELGFNCAIGVTTGLALCSAVGAAARREYTMMGSIVNRSARLMQVAAADAAGSGRLPVLCDTTTYRNARARLAFESLPPLALKGVAEPVTVYRPLPAGAAQAAVPARESAEQVDVLVGRERELTLLRNLVSATAGGRSGALLIEGEAGIGKSRLIAALREEAQAAGVTVYSGAGSPVEKTPYFAWRPIISAMLNLEEAGEARLAETSGEWAAMLGELAPLAPLLGAVAPVDMAETPLTAQMVGQVRADNTRDLLLRLIESAAGRGPILLAFDDAHWLDTSSWALLHAALDRPGPLLLTVAARPTTETTPEYQRLNYRPDTRHLPLRGLAPAAIHELLLMRLGVTSVPEELWRLIAERSQGNPFLSAELAYALRESGAISCADGVCRVVGTAPDPTVALLGVGLPETIQGLITSRIDRLTPPQQLTLKVASVIGPSFTLSALAAIHPVEQDGDRLVDQLFALQQAGLVAIESFEPELLYAFKPAAASEVAYNLMSVSQRRRLHRTLAERLGTGEGGAASYAQLAHHWRQADEPGRAMPYLAEAGEQALYSGAYREAAAFLADALAIAEAVENRTPIDDLSLARWERQLGAAYHGMGRLIESRELLERAATRLGYPPPRRSRALLTGLGRELLAQLKLRLLPPRLAAHPGSAPVSEAARVYATLSQLAYYDSQLLVSTYAALRGLNLAEGAGLSPELAGSYASCQVVLGMFPPLARVYRRLAGATAARLGHLPTTLWVAEARALYALGHADWRVALGATQHALALAERLGDQRRRAECRAMLCLTISHQGDYRGALAGCLELEAAGARHGDVQIRTWGLVGAAENLLILSDLGRATVLLVEAEGLLAENLGSARSEEIWTYALMARAALLRGEPELARSLASAAGGLIERVPQAAIYALAGYSATAEVYLGLWEEGRFAGARARRELISGAATACRALARFALIFPVARPATLLWGGLYAWLSGRRWVARRRWAQAARLAHKLGMPYDEARAHLQLGRHTEGETSRRHREQATVILARLGLEGQH